MDRKVVNGKQAKDIASDYLKNIGLELNFGLAEPVGPIRRGVVTFGYHEWKVPLLKDQTCVGEIYIDAFTEKVNKDRTTDVDIINSRLRSVLPCENIKEKKKERYPISPLSNTIVCGDALIELDALPEQSVDLIITSPPYYNARPQYKEYDTYESYLEFMRLIIRKCKYVLVGGRFFVMNISHVIIPRSNRNESSKRIAVPFDFHRIFIEEGYEFMEDIIWQKPEGAGWASGRGRRFAADRNPLQYKTVPVTEYVLVYRKKSDRLIDWFIRNHPDKQIIQESKIEDYYEKTNVWYISPARSAKHPAIFPMELVENVINYYSFKNDVVLDPFAGIGTVGVVAARLGRKYYLIEKESKYISDFNPVEVINREQ